eukprot:TRINITY_DN32198_c0_g1_i1.p1 TRINITY_DN32198_c0_g1~~TRINITY_DN32198_c0_g1_i1.p1  ORF type:complete len:169 (-),score=31.62 TRINITY_DN32198_c0_g1_i1:149-655(-)
MAFSLHNASSSSVQKLTTAYSVQQAVLNEQTKVVCLRVGNEFDHDCMRMDAVLAEAANTTRDTCNIYTVEVRDVPECVQEFQVSDPSSMPGLPGPAGAASQTTAMAVVFFFKGRLLQLDLGSGPRPKISWAIENQQEFVDLLNAVHHGAQQGREVITAPKDYSMQFRY